MRRSQNVLLLEPDEIQKFFLNVVFLKNMKLYSLNPQKHEKNLAQSRGGSAYTFPETQCILNGLFQHVFKIDPISAHLKYIGFLEKCVPSHPKTGPNFFRVSEGSRNKISWFLEISRGNEPKKVYKWANTTDFDRVCCICSQIGSENFPRKKI